MMCICFLILLGVLLVTCYIKKPFNSLGFGLAWILTRFSERIEGRIENVPVIL